MSENKKNLLSDDDIVLCREFSSDLDARIAQEKLKENDIPSILDNETFSSIIPIPFNTIGGIRLMVYAHDLNRATGIINEMKVG